MKKSIHLALAVSGVLTLAACASGGGSASSSGPVALHDSVAAATAELLQLRNY